MRRLARRAIRPWRSVAAHVAYFITAAIPASIAGSPANSRLPARPITAGIGVLLLAIVALRRLGRLPDCV